LNANKRRMFHSFFLFCSIRIEKEKCLELSNKFSNNSKGASHFFKLISDTN
jgi:hypothetical protein